MAQRWLIIGCGYLGRRLASALSAEGARVLASTRSPTTAEEFARRGWEPVRLDVTQVGQSPALPVADVVVWAVGFDRSAGPSQREVYVEGLRAVVAGLPSPGRFVYVSSTSVYGQCEGEWVDETTPAEPSTDSGRICREAERVLERAVADRQFPGLTLRLSGLYGPDRWPGLETLRAGRRVSGRPERWLNLIHVEDAVAAVRAVAEPRHRAAPGEVVLASDDEPIPRGEYYQRLAERFGLPAPVFDGSDTDRASRRIRNRRLREDFGVTLRYPSVRGALAEVTSPCPP